MKKSIIVPAQIRAARAMLEWSQEELAENSGVSLSTVRDVESQ
ncbi:MAG: helix-turn-helix domain-containing protein, partial [Acidobacteria bacterium]|nr:helix-turn-helix domain-containing protein [Acidobacteriota bacterium]